MPSSLPPTASSCDATGRPPRPAEPWAGSRGGLLIVHGLASTPAATSTSASMAAAGLDVHAYDHRGKGGSGGRRGDVDRWSLLHDDLAERLATASCRRRRSRPSCCTATRWALIVAGYSADPSAEARPRGRLSSPGLDSTLAAGRSAGRCSAGSPDGRHPERRAARRHLPRSVGRRRPGGPVLRQTSTARFGGAFAEQARVRRRRRRTRRPTLVLHGLDDGLVPPRASEVFAGPRRRAADLPGPSPRAPQRAGGPGVIDEIIAWLRTGRGRGTLTANRTPPPGSASSAESVARNATDPRNLIRFVPAKEAGPIDSP